MQADQIKLKVSKGDVSSQLSVESGQVSISGNRFVLEADNCSISADGTITAKNAVMTGSFKSIGEDGSYTEVSSGEIKFYNELLQSTGSIKGLGQYLTIDASMVSVSGILVVGNGATYDSQYVKNISTTSQILGSKTVLTSATLSVTKNYINGTVSDVSLVTQTANVADYPGHNVNFITGVSSLGGLLTATSGIVTLMT